MMHWADSRRAMIAFTFIVIAVVALASARLITPAGMSVTTVRAAILVLFTIASWATGLLEEPLTTLLFLLLAILFELAPAAVILSGFQSPAWWLMFGGSITGVAVRTTGFGARIASVLVDCSRASYFRCVSAVALAALFLAFIMPSTTGRVLILVPMVLALCERVSFAPGSNGRTGLVMTAAAVSYMPPCSILSANIPNNVLMGAAESLYGVHLSYGAYLLLHFPVLGVLKTVVLVALVCRLYPERHALTAIEEKRSAPLSGPEIRLIIVLAASLAFFATDALHGISPAWIALAAGVTCLLPVVGVLSLQAFTGSLVITPLLYVAGFLGLGALIEHSGLSKSLLEIVLRAFPILPGEPLHNLVLLASIGAGTGLLTTLPGLPAVLTPVSQALADSASLPLLSVLMLQVIVFSTVFLPYQAPPMLIAMHLAGVRLREGVRLCLACAAITTVVLLPIDVFWWRLLGYL